MVLRDLHFSLNQPLKSVDSYYTVISKNTVKTQEHVIFQVLLIVPVK